MIFMSDRAIVFGAGGALGSVVCARFQRAGIDVLPVTRGTAEDEAWVSTGSSDWIERLANITFNRVVFAQGRNSASAVQELDAHELREVFEANVFSIMAWTRELVVAGVLSQNARICIVGSVWANVSRRDKAAYVVSKSAVSGLVRSFCSDLAPQGIVTNAILPGVIESPMAHQFLTAESRAKLETETPGGRLVAAEELAAAVLWLTGVESTGICGQSIVMDHGWSVTRSV